MNKSYEAHEKQNQLARAKEAWKKRQEKEAAENYRKMIGRKEKKDEDN